jgi:phosphate transport system protein
MGTMERHFEQELDLLSETLLRMGGLVEEAIGRSVRSLVERDAELARQVVAADAEVDALELEIDRQCMEILARHQPMARDLRFVATAMKITPDLERIADLATNISERAIELSEEPPLKPFVDIPLMAARAQRMVHGALDAFVRRDAEAALAVIRMDDDLDHRMEQIFRVLLSYMMENPRNISRALRLTFVAKYFERIGDQSTNICEQVVYMVQGQVIKHTWLSDGEIGGGKP